MIRPSAALPAAALFVIAQLAPNLPALAQQERPVGAPVQLAPLTPQSPAPAESPPPATAGPAAPGTIVVEGLADIDSEAIGLLGPSQGGLGTAMWAGSRRDLVQRLLPLLPATPPYAAARDLARRLLLTAAAPPAGPSDGVSLLALRVERLTAMGDIAAASALADASPDRQSNPDLTLTSFERRLLENDVTGACSLASLVTLTTLYWQKAQIFCHAISGEVDFATLGLELLREQGDDDPAFVVLTAKLNGNRGGTPESGSASPLTLALLRATQTPIPDWFVAAAGPAVLAALAFAPEVELPLRLQAAERAERLGALPTPQLAELYRSLNLTAEQIAGATAPPGALPGVTQQAASYLAAHARTVPAARAEALRAGLAAARAQGNHRTLARLSTDLLGQIAPAPSLAWFAPDAIRAALLTGDAERALAWYRLARAEAAFDAAAAQAAALSWPLLRLAIGDSREASLAWDSGSVDLWLQARSGQDAATAAAPAALLLALLDAQGEPVDPGRWSSLIDATASPSTAPSPALWFALDDAAIAGRLGETILLALLALGDQSVSQPQILPLHLVVRSLNRVGLTAEARTLAVEAAVTAGL